MMMIRKLIKIIIMREREREEREREKSLAFNLGSI